MPELSLQSRLDSLIALPFQRMEKRDRIRASCYLHARYKQISNEEMTNESFRKRLDVADNRSRKHEITYRSGPNFYVTLMCTPSAYASTSTLVILLLNSSYSPCSHPY